MDTSTTPQNTNDNRPVTEEDLANMTPDQMMDAFVMQLLVDRGIADVEESVLAKFHEDVKNQLMFEINRAILAALPEDKFAEVSKGLEEGSMGMDEVGKIVNEQGIDVDQITEEVMLKFREIYLSAPVDGGEAAAVENQEA